MKVLVVDDEKNIRESITRFLKLENIEVKLAENGISAQRILNNEYFHAAVIDLKMPGINGLELIRWIKNEGLNLPIIMISAFGEVKDAVEAMKLGARDYIVKPFDPEELTLKLKRLIEEKIIHDKLNSELNTARKPDLPAGEVNSRKMREVVKLIQKVAATPSTVLITGESGTGKEVTAKQIHNISPGDSFPFIAVNLGGMPETLIESELFGYERGAFTGAIARKPGMFELAASGTIFLDEIGDMPLHLQVKLLRVLQDKKIQRLGGTQVIPINTRIIAATNKNLENLVKEGKFREDLYYRLNIFQINLPPLRDRMEDLPQLISYFIDKFNSIMSKQITGIDEGALEILKSYSFPGNIRELENIIERAFILSDDKIIKPADLGLPGNTPGAGNLTGAVIKKKKNTKLRELEREAIKEALHKWEGNRTKAAEELGITRRTLFNKIKEYKLE